MRVRVGEVDDKVKQTKGGTIYRAKCSWDGYQEQWTSLYFQPQSGAEYDAKVKSREWQGKIYWTVSEGQLVGAPLPATAATPAPVQTAPKAEYSPAIHKEAVVLMHKQAWAEALGVVQYAVAPEHCADSLLIAAARLTTSIIMGWVKDGHLYPQACKAVKQMRAQEDGPSEEELPAQRNEEGARGGASSSGDELPTDDNIPF